MACMPNICWTGINFSSNLGICHLSSVMQCLNSFFESIRSMLLWIFWKNYKAIKSFGTIPKFERARVKCALLIEAKFKKAIVDEFRDWVMKWPPNLLKPFSGTLSDSFNNSTDFAGLFDAVDDAIVIGEKYRLAAIWIIFGKSYLNGSSSTTFQKGLCWQKRTEFDIGS